MSKERDVSAYFFVPDDADGDLSSDEESDQSQEQSIDQDSELSVSDLAAESFFSAFFDDSEEPGRNSGDDENFEFVAVDPGLLEQLQNMAQQTEETFSERVTVESFNKGVQMVGGLVSLFGQLAASCGPLCLHALSGASSLASAGGAGGISSGFAGLGSVSSGLSFDGAGNVSFSGSVDDLSWQTGVSKSDILSGKFSSDDLLARLVEGFGNGAAHLLGFGLIDIFVGFLVPDSK